MLNYSVAELRLYSFRELLPIGSGFTNVLLSKNHRTPNATRSDTERNPIGHRTQPDQTADAIQSDSERNPIRFRTQSDRTPNANRSDSEREPMPIALQFTR